MPISGGKYVAPQWNNGTQPYINASELQAISDSVALLPIANGGTGATTVAGARNALGLGNTSGALPIANGGTGEDIARIADTETHRIANQAAYETAKKAGATEKTWHCMMLPTSRDSHIYLDGVTAPIDGEFYSFKGGSTQFPGQWGIAEEDVNCLCWLSFSK